jgi:xanthine/uracil/vitamin C permease (AzgA family)
MDLDPHQAESLPWSKLNGTTVSAVVAFLFVAIFDISGVMFGMGRLAQLTNEDESIPGRWVSACLAYVVIGHQSSRLGT